MSHKAQQARIHAAECRKLVGGKPPRTYGETRRLEIEIALGTHRGETCRAMRLGCSHVHCWRVARNYHRGLIPILPPDEQGLLAMRDSLGLAPPPSPVAHEGAPPHQAPPEPARHLYEIEGGESRWMTAAEYDDYCIAEQRRFAEKWKRKNPPRYDTRRRISVPIPR